jgi:formylglycine-generating enzyme required for sulfatase activity
MGLATASTHLASYALPIVSFIFVCPPFATLHAAEHKPGDTREDNELKMALAWCPPGTFLMGSPGTEEDSFPDTGEKPQVKVTLSNGFWIGTCEVTQRQWRHLMNTEPWTEHKDVKKGALVRKGPEYPAVCITYSGEDSVREFCQKFTLLELRSKRLLPDEEYRLPTEAEWEYACRAGTTTRYSFGNDPDDGDKYAWWGELLTKINGKSVERGLHPVGQKRKNKWGIYDLHGNAAEWCSDLVDTSNLVKWGRLPGGTDPHVTNVPLPPFQTSRIIRGGDSTALPADCRCAARGAVGHRDFDKDPLSMTTLGFRIVRGKLTKAKTE